MVRLEEVRTPEPKASTAALKGDVMQPIVPNLLTRQQITILGISAKIRNAYSFLSHNWNFREGEDEIVLVGFSRGAFAVQCLASLISDAGLLQKQHLYYLRGLFTLWANQKSPRGGEKYRVYQAKLQSFRLLHQVKITACAVWDTVSSLGGIVQLSPRPLAFVGKEVPDRVQHAFQAVALDEERSKFQPVLWTSKPATASVSQCWFLGSHADVGGNGDAALGGLSLVWMVGKLHGELGVAFDDKEIAKHLKHRFLEWDITVSRFSHSIKETKRAVATMPHSGESYQSMGCASDREGGLIYPQVSQPDKRGIGGYSGSRHGATTLGTRSWCPHTSTSQRA